MRFLLTFFLMAFSTQAAAENFSAIGIESCEIYSFYLSHPDSMDRDVRLRLSTVEAVAEATGLPRGSFRSDFIAYCREKPESSPDEVINAVFKKYLDQVR